MVNQPMGNHGLGIFWCGFDLGPLLQGQMRRAKVKSAYNLLIIGPRGLQCEINLYESCPGNLLMWSDLILEVCHVKLTHRKSWAGNLLMLLDLTFGPSFKVK